MELIAFLIGVIAGGVTVFFVLRKNPKLLGSVEYLEGKLKELKEKV